MHDAKIEGMLIDCVEMCHACYDSVPRLKAGRKKRVVV